jgi:hypothetical protein
MDWHFSQDRTPVLPASISPDYDFAHAHNELLQATDLGVPGLVALLAIYFGTFGMLWSLWHGAPDLETRYLALGLAGGLLAHAIYGFTDAIARRQTESSSDVAIEHGFFSGRGLTCVRQRNRAVRLMASGTTFVKLAPPGTCS